MEYTINDKITQWIIKNFDEDYVYEDNHYRIMLNNNNELEFMFWNLNITEPNLKEMDNIDMTDYVKRFPINSIESIIQRLEKIEKILSTK